MAKDETDQEIQDKIDLIMKEFVSK